MSSVRRMPCFRASRTRPQRKRIALEVFGPQFQKTLGRNLFQKIGSPEKVASNPISLALAVPGVRQQYARKAFAAPFSPQPEGNRKEIEKTMIETNRTATKPQRNSPTGTIYLLHFERAYYHAHHYLGWTERAIEQRLDRHMVGTGARLISVVTEAGIGMEVARLWAGTRALERQLKNRKNSPKLCPICLRKQSSLLKTRQLR